MIARLDGEARQERSVLQQDFDTRLAAAEARHRDTVKRLEQQVRELEVQTMQSTTAVQSRERVLVAEVEGLKEDLSAAREELELLRLEAITSNRLAEDCQMQLDAVRAARSKDRDELRQETEDKVRWLGLCVIMGQRSCAKVCRTRRGMPLHLSNVSCFCSPPPSHPHTCPCAPNAGASPYGGQRQVAGAAGCPAGQSPAGHGGRREAARYGAGAGACTAISTMWLKRFAPGSGV